MAKAFETKSLGAASADELRQYATSFLGIPTDGLSDGEVVAKVRAANDGDTIYVRVAPEPADQTGAPPPEVEGAGTGTGGLVGGLGHTDPKVRVTLHAEERDGVVTSRHKEVGVNGVVWLIKRGESVEIPLRVYYALASAERENITHDDEGNVNIQRVKNTPYNVERMPPQEEIDAWFERVHDDFVPA